MKGIEEQLAPFGPQTLPPTLPNRRYHPLTAEYTEEDRIGEKSLLFLFCEKKFGFFFFLDLFASSCHLSPSQSQKAKLKNDATHRENAEWSRLLASFSMRGRDRRAGSRILATSREIWYTVPGMVGLPGRPLLSLFSCCRRG